jgi:hypothetical protein
MGACRSTWLLGTVETHRKRSIGKTDLVAVDAPTGRTANRYAELHVQRLQVRRKDYIGQEGV